MKHLSRHWKTKELIEETGKKSQEWRIYKPGKKFKVSRSGVENFKDCPRCFYLNVRKGLKDIDTIPFTLNNTVDSLVKAEFDHCREKQIPHEVMKDANINAELTLPGCPENPGATIAKTVLISPLLTYSSKTFSTFFTMLSV